jgi:hypothetical protein
MTDLIGKTLRCLEEQLPGDPYYGCNAFLALLKFYGNRRAMICDREFVGA